MQTGDEGQKGFHISAVAIPSTIAGVVAVDLIAVIWWKILHPSCRSNNLQKDSSLTSSETGNIKTVCVPMGQRPTIVTDAGRFKQQDSIVTNDYAYMHQRIERTQITEGRTAEPDTAYEDVNQKESCNVIDSYNQTESSFIGIAVNLLYGLNTHAVYTD